MYTIYTYIDKQIKTHVPVRYVCICYSGNLDVYRVRSCLFMMRLILRLFSVVDTTIFESTQNLIRLVKYVM